MMVASGPFRLEKGGRIDRQQPLAFSYDGRQVTAFSGDTLASALLASGERVLGRSFKYHRPRGVFSAGVEEPNALLRVEHPEGRESTVRATCFPAVQGLAVAGQNAWPSVRFDVARILDLSHRLWPAGFYNKTFIWPNWRAYEQLIRRTAGLGELQDRELRLTPATHLHCDVLVCGAGPAGLLAASRVAEQGASVVLLEQDFLLGGSLLHGPCHISGSDSEEWLRQSVDGLTKLDNVTILRSTTATGLHNHGLLSAVEQRVSEHNWQYRAFRIRASKIILATGAIEQPLLFPGNDRPGVMLAGAVGAYLHRYAVACGRRAVIATTNDDGFALACDLHDHGVQVAAIIDTRKSAGSALADRASERGIRVVLDATLTASHGFGRLRRVEWRSTAARGRDTVDCDLVAVAGGWQPTVHLYSQAGGRLENRPGQSCFLPAGTLADVLTVGAANGLRDLHGCLNDARQAADTALGYAPRQRPSQQHEAEAAPTVSSPTPVNEHSDRQWIDLQYDVTLADIELAAREGLHSIEHVKRYTTVGMSIDQGKTSNLLAVRALGQQIGATPDSVGTTTFRPPFTPVPFAAFSGACNGRLYRPLCFTPLVDWQKAHGAVFEDYGRWRRPACYLSGKESRKDTIRREVLKVRNGVGVFDASPLGKIEIHGPDAAEFLHRIYVNNIRTLGVGHVRYGIMLNDNGVVFDDGVVARIEQDRYLVGTTSGNAQRVYEWLEEWHQCEWPQLRLVMQEVTTHWGVITVAGPSSRELLERLPLDLDVSAANFPHMAFRQGRYAGHSVRAQRVSYCGELCYEVSVPSSLVADFWDDSMREGESLGIDAFGMEAVLLMRIEKGFLHVGSDTDGTTNAYDIGFGAIVEKQQDDFIGRRSLARSADRDPWRRQLVGIRATGDTPLTIGAHIVAANGNGWQSQGFVTSACESPATGESIGLAMVAGGLERKGERVTLFDLGAVGEAQLCEASFYDVDGDRMHA